MDTTATLGKRSASTYQVAMVLGAAIGLCGGFASFYFGTLSVFLGPIANSFGWSRGEVSAVTPLGMLGLAIGAPIVGRLIDRFGAQRVVPASVALFALSLVVLTLLPGVPGLFAVASLLIGIVGAATTPAGYLTVLPRHFEGKLGLALGLSMVGLGVGTILAPIVTSGLIAQSGWQGAYRTLATGALVMGGIGCFLMFRGTRETPTSTRSSTAAEAGFGLSFGEAAGQWIFWALAAALFVASAAGLGAAVHVVTLFTDRGVPLEQAARGAAFAGLGVMLGRLAAGFLMDVVHAPRVIAGAFLLGAAGLAVLASGSAAFPVIALGAVLFGFCIGAEGDFIPFMIKRYFGLKAFGSIFGFFFFVYSFGGVVGPAIYGIGFDRLGDYSPILVAAAVGCVASALTVLAVGPYRFGVRR